MDEKAVAVIMVGGPTTGTRFRPLTLQQPKPLIPLGGKPMVHHPIQACKKIPNLLHVFLIGFFEEKEFSLYISSLSTELQVPVRYLREDKSHGSAGGLLHFKDIILEDSPDHVFVINCDVCSSFPLVEMLEAHKKHAGLGTLLTKKVAPDVASEFGELVSDPETSEILHYAEKPTTFVSDKINCGVYIFSPAIMDEIKAASEGIIARAADNLPTAPKNVADTFVRLDQDIFTPLAGKKKLFAFEYSDFWEQIKTPGLALRCSALYLSQFREQSPALLASSGEGKPTVVGDVFIHPSAKVHPTAKIGPNVSILSNARVGAGARLQNCIILDGVEVKENALVAQAFIGWKSLIGKWARVQGTGDVNSKLGTTILGEDVTVGDEVVIVNCISLPHKSLSSSMQDEIIL